MATIEILKKEFLNSYPEFPEHMTELGQFVFYRTYSRWLEDKGRKETWREAVARAVTFSIQQSIYRLRDISFDVNEEKQIVEAETLFDNIFNLRQFLSGRTHWVGGADTGIGEKFPMANFNCSFTNIESYNDLSELFYLLLIGTGVGVKCTKKMAANLPELDKSIVIKHDPYEPIDKHLRLEDTEVRLLENGFAKIYIGDSKEGWVTALEDYLYILQNPEGVHTITFSYNSIRPKGEKLATFGGTASGHESLRDMFIGIDRVIKSKVVDTWDHDYYAEVNTDLIKLEPIDILDIANLIGNNVVVGGVRRTAEIFLCDWDDFDVIFAKYGINGIWDEEMHRKIMVKVSNIAHKYPKLQEIYSMLNSLPKNDPDARPLHHRRMSNNSIAFTEKPPEEIYDLIFTMIRAEGEPGFVNLEAAQKRRPNAQGLNPCAEILLDNKGVCNLTTINVRAFVLEEEIDDKIMYRLDFQGLAQAQSLSVRAGIRMTLLDMELDNWDEVHKRDRLIGASLTGWKDAMELLDYDEQQEINLLATLRDIAFTAANQYAYILRIPAPLLITTIKPEGTLSQVAGGVSSGLHYSHSPYFIRRIRINASDPIAKAVRDIGWRWAPEVGQTIDNHSTIVVDFPVKSGAKKTKNDVSALEQLENYLNFQTAYTDQNSSNTITVKPDEWQPLQEKIWQEWDNFIGISFLAHDGGSYPLAPYEECTEEEYNNLKASMEPLTKEILEKYDGPEEGGDLEGVENCESGACPIR